MSISHPASGAYTGTTVHVTAVVSDNVKVMKVEFRVDNVVLASASTGPYSFKLNLKPGKRVIKVTGRDTSGLVSHATVYITVNGASSGKGAPAPTPPGPGTSSPLGTFGSTCASPDQCSSNLCANDLTLGRSYCTQDCSTKACPSGAGCFSSTGGMSICAPLTSPELGGDDYAPSAQVAGSGCSLGSGANGTTPAALALLVLGCFMMLLRRRR